MLHKSVIYHDLYSWFIGVPTLITCLSNILALGNKKIFYFEYTLFGAL